MPSHPEPNRDTSMSAIISIANLLVTVLSPLLGFLLVT